MMDDLKLNTMPFLHQNIDTARPTPGFAVPPYHVEIFPGHSPEGWHCVCNAQGFNCLSFADKPGAKFTSLELATAICERFNAT